MICIDMQHISVSCNLAEFVYYLAAKQPNYKWKGKVLKKEIFKNIKQNI